MGPPDSYPTDLSDLLFLADNTVDVICRMSLSMVFSYVSPSSISVLGWKPEQMVGQSPNAFLEADDLNVLAAAITLGLHADIAFSPLTARMRKPDQSIAWVEIASRIIRHSRTAEPMDVLLIMRDVTARTVMEDHLFALAHTDSLTGLSNRRAFDLALDRDWKRTIREHSHMSLLLLDLDQFKQFNDRYGHQAGDDCLRAVASVVSAAIQRATDTVARYGGEEIAIILPCTDVIGAREIAEQLRSVVIGLGIPHENNAAAQGLVSVSIGVATVIVKNGASTVEMPRRLFLCVDAALYKAKQEGRNRIVADSLFVSPPV